MKYNITTQEAKALGEKIQPLLKQGLSPYAILQAHPEIKLSEKTLYTYIENKVFEGLVDIGPMDLRRQVNRKISRKKANSYKKREDRRYLIRRKYKDYQSYMAENPNVFVTQMDTVYNDVSNVPFIQTYKFVSGEFLFCCSLFLPVKDSYATAFPCFHLILYELLPVTHHPLPVPEATFSLQQHLHPTF